MFAPLVRFLWPDGRTVIVPAGGIVGRLATATLRLDDPRVSEAHALVSLRGDLLWILALRGPIEVDGKVVREAPLARGNVVRLAEGVALTVESVELPSEVLALAIGDRLHPLHGEVMSLVDDRVVPRFVESAELRLWTSGVGWRGQAHGRPFDIRPGVEVPLSTGSVRFRAVSHKELAAQSTHGAGLSLPLRIRTTLDELRVVGPNRLPLIVGGLPARIVRELADYAEPVPWEDVARVVLGPDDEVGLRSRWDRNLKTLRRKLEEYGYRNDLVRADGHGCVRLAVSEADEVEVV